MPSSGYAAWSVVADEQPTAAKWNILGSNDASFNTGLGFNDDIIIARHIADGAVLPANINLSTMGTIASTVTTGNFQPTTDIQTLSYAIPAGCSKVLIIGTARLQAQNNALQDMVAWVNYDGVTNSKSGIFTATQAFQGGNISILDILTVAGGTTKTFKLQANTSGGGLMNVGSRHIFIIPINA